MSLESLVTAALRGDRNAAMALATRHFDWPRDQRALLGRGDPDALARLQAQATTLLAGRSTPPLAPTILGDHAPQALSQLTRCLDHDDVLAGALCADGHPGYAQPVGAVIAYREHISVSGVGFDIGCGNLAIRTNLPLREVAPRLDAVLDAIQRDISFGVGRANAAPPDHPIFDDTPAWLAADAMRLRTAARQQLGTVGGGNHYVDLFHEALPDTPPADSPVWIGLHFGSRGLGHRLATHYLKLAGGQDGMDVRPALLHQDTDLGRAYIAAMHLAGRYAEAGRDWVGAHVLRILGGAESARIHNHHNFAWREEVAGSPAWVVRKGCTPAFPGQAGFVGGSMGDDAVILEGVDSPEASALLHSTVHGAGRLFGRAEARRRFVRAEMDDWLARRGIALRGGDLDEAPMAYRRLDDVLAAHAGSVRVLHRLRPFAVVMAGADVIDPYKD